MRVSIYLRVMVLLCSNACLPGCFQRETCSPPTTRALIMEVRAADLDAAPGGEAWDDDGTAPDVSVEFLCGDRWAPSNVKESNAPLWLASEGTVACELSPQALADGVPFRVVDVDLDAKELLLDVPFVNIGEADFARGSVTLSAPGFPGSVTLELATDGEEASAVVQRFHVELPTARTAWDRDGSPPDVVVEFSCGAPGVALSKETEALDMTLAPGGVPYDGGIHPRPGCRATREAMYRSGLMVRMWDVDGFEPMGSGEVHFPEQVEGTVSFPASGFVRRLDVALAKGHYGCL